MFRKALTHRTRYVQTTGQTFHKIFKNVKIVEFHHCIENHLEKCIDISTNIPSIGLVIPEITFCNFAILHIFCIIFGDVFFTLILSTWSLVFIFAHFLFLPVFINFIVSQICCYHLVRTWGTHLFQRMTTEVLERFFCRLSSHILMPITTDCM